jgi:hypothetical protein
MSGMIPLGHIAIDNTFGACLIGTICSAVLYGVTCVQTWFYYTRYGNDPLWIKSLVLVCWICDTLHLICISHSVYYYLVSQYNVPLALFDMVWSILVEIFFNAIIGLLVQGFLTMRVWRLSGGNIPVTLVISAFVLAEFITTIIFAIKSLQMKTFIELLALKNLSMSTNVIAATSAVLIAGVLCYLLQNSRTGFKKSDSMITKLIVFSMNTGVLTSICALGSMISVIVWGHALIYAAFYFCMGRLYCNSLLATLNARRSIRGIEEENESSYSLRGVQKNNGSVGGLKKQNGISIKIDTTQEYARDHLDLGADQESTMVETKAAYTDQIA